MPNAFVVTHGRERPNFLRGRHFWRTTTDDLPKKGDPRHVSFPSTGYPIEMARALAITYLLRLLQEIPLGEVEQAAVEDGVAAYENLLSKLTDVPTPAGPTPRQIGAGFVQVTSVRPALPASTLTDSRSNGAGSREPD